MGCSLFPRLALLCALTVWLSAAPARAQESPVVPAGADTVQEGVPATGQAAPTDIEKILQDEQLRIGIEEAFQRKIKLRQADVDPARLQTMFFTIWQHALLQEAKARFMTRTPDASEIANDGQQSSEQAVRGVREVRLGGIAYAGPLDWTVWLNGKRITPAAIPKEVIDIKVAGDFIELKWYDAFTDLIFPVRLRPHQRFNLDSRIFLPGEGAPQ